MSTLRNVASITPRKGKFIVWAQSPNGYWMLIAGEWQRREHAEAWLHHCGYRIVPWPMALAEIEVQMEKAQATIGLYIK